MSLYKIKMKLKNNNFLYRIYSIYKDKKVKKLYEEQSKTFVKHSKAALKVIIDSLEKQNKLNYFWVYGNLLGLIREKKFIEHDCDMDIGIMYDDSFSWDFVDECMKKCGFVRFRSFTINDVIEEITYKNDLGLSIDFFLFKEDSSNHTLYTYEFCRERGVMYDSKYDMTVYRYYHPSLPGITKINLDDIIYRIPENYEQFLVESYGENWRIPDPNWSSSNSSRVSSNEKGILHYY